MVADLHYDALFLLFPLQSVGNVIDTALGCERVLSSLPMVRWSQPVFDAAAQLLESATSFIAANLSGILSSDRLVEMNMIAVSEIWLFGQMLEYTIFLFFFFLLLPEM